jgi:flavin reductase (NADH)/flavin reductase/chlorophenol-4-monooxygenase component 1
MISPTQPSQLALDDNQEISMTHLASYAAKPATGFTSTDFKSALSNAVTPVTVLATNGQAGLAGVTCSAVCSVCDTPPTILCCVNRSSFANSIIKENGVVSVNWLSAHQSELSQMFAGVGKVPMPERFHDAEWDTLVTGAPVSRNALLSLDCQISEVREFGTHSIFLARVLASTRADDRDPLLYCQRSYATTTPAPLPA